MKLKAILHDCTGNLISNEEGMPITFQLTTYLTEIALPSSMVASLEIDDCPDQVSYVITYNQKIFHRTTEFEAWCNTIWQVYQERCEG